MRFLSCAFLHALHKGEPLRCPADQHPLATSTLLEAVAQSGAVAPFLPRFWRTACKFRRGILERGCREDTEGNGGGDIKATPASYQKTKCSINALAGWRCCFGACVLPFIGSVSSHGKAEERPTSHSSCCTESSPRTPPSCPPSDRHRRVGLVVQTLPQPPLCWPLLHLSGDPWRRQGTDSLNPAT